MSNKIAIVRVRGKVKVKKVVEDTLRMLRLYNKNYCVIIDNSQTANGMIQKVKDYVTFGEVSDKIFLELVIKRGEIYSGRTQDSKGKIKYLRRYFEYDNKKYNKYFRLAPPKKGYRSIKKAFSQGGALGNRKDKINDLLLRMI